MIAAPSSARVAKRRGGQRSRARCPGCAARSRRLDARAVNQSEPRFRLELPLSERPLQ